MVTVAELIAEARSWAGTPFVHQARQKGVGVDCVGLAIGVGRATGFLAQDFDVNGYGREPKDGQMLAWLEANCEPSEPIPGAIVAFRWFREGQHVALVARRDDLGYDTLIHAGGGFQSVTEHRFDDKWRRRMVGAFKLPGVQY